MMGRNKEDSEEEILWEGKKRLMLFGLPWTFTSYKITESRLFVRKGFLTTRYDEVRLYRIRDVGLSRTLAQKLIGTGTIAVSSTDSSMKNFDLVNIKNSERVAEILSSATEKAREKTRVSARELMVDTDIEDEGE